jgi:site-specific DNA-cytosine methylase
MAVPCQPLSQIGLREVLGTMAMPCQPLSQIGLREAAGSWHKHNSLFMVAESLGLQINPLVPLEGRYILMPMVQLIRLRKLLNLGIC